MSKIHSSHPGIVKRLRRAEGHLRTIIEMIGSHRDCLELAQQLHAVEMAITNAKKALIHDHIESCLERSSKQKSRDGRAALAEFKEITKYL